MRLPVWMRACYRVKVRLNPNRPAYDIELKPRLFGIPAILVGLAMAAWASRP